MKAPILEGMFKPGNKTFSILSVILVILIIVGVFAVFYIMQHSSADKQLFAYATEQRLLAQSIEANAYRSLTGEQKAFSQLKILRDKYSELILSLVNAESLGRLSRLSENSQEGFTQLEQNWQQYNKSIEAILSAQEQIFLIKHAADRIQESIPGLSRFSNEVLKALVRTRANAEQINIAIQQLMLVQRLSNYLSLGASDVSDRYAVAGRISQDVKVFGQTLKGLIRGDSGSA